MELQVLKEKVEGKAAIERQAMFDSVRIVLTALVIVHHAAIVYGGAGSWYWLEKASSSDPVLVTFTAINQSFFMGFFFLIAGYFSAVTLERKGKRKFLAGRLLRLGLPLAVYFLFISPLTISLAETAQGGTFGATFRSLFQSGQLEPGPLWFVQALLLFSVCYVGWHSLFGNIPQASCLPSAPKLLAAGLTIGSISFVVRFWFPVGHSVLWLQLGYFPLYIFLFLAGCLSYRSRILENITLEQALPWMILSFVAILSLPLAMNGVLGTGEFEGGYSFNAFYYAIWDPAVAFGVILGALWLFQTLFNKGGPATAFLARRAYAVYIVHPPILVAFGILLADWAAHPVAKTAVLGFVAWVGCVAIASLLLSLPSIKRVI